MKHLSEMEVAERARPLIQAAWDGTLTEAMLGNLIQRSVGFEWTPGSRPIKSRGSGPGTQAGHRVRLLDPIHQRTGLRSGPLGAPLHLHHRGLWWLHRLRQVLEPKRQGRVSNHGFAYQSRCSTVGRSSRPHHSDDPRARFQTSHACVVGVNTAENTMPIALIIGVLIVDVLQNAGLL